MQAYRVTVVNGEASVEERSFLESIGDSITTLLSTDKAVVGIAPALVTGALAYGMGVLVKQRHTGQLSFNPF